MSKISVGKFASELGILPEVLLEQLRAAGVSKHLTADDVTEKDKVQLLDYLRKIYGSKEEKGRITLSRQRNPEMKRLDRSGKTHEIRFVVRDKKRSDIEKKFAARIVEIEVAALRLEEFFATPIANGQCAGCSQMTSRERVNTNHGMLALCPECTCKARCLSIKPVASKMLLPEIRRPKKKRSSFFRFLQGGSPGLGKRSS